MQNLGIFKRIFYAVSQNHLKTVIANSIADENFHVSLMGSAVFRNGDGFVCRIMNEPRQNDTLPWTKTIGAIGSARARL